MTILRKKIAIDALNRTWPIMYAAIPSKFSFEKDQSYSLYNIYPETDRSECQDWANNSFMELDTPNCDSTARLKNIEYLQSAPVRSIPFGCHEK